MRKTRLTMAIGAQGRPARLKTIPRLDCRTLFRYVSGWTTRITSATSWLICPPQRRRLSLAELVQYGLKLAQNVGVAVALFTVHVVERFGSTAPGGRGVGKQVHDVAPLFYEIRESGCCIRRHTSTVSRRSVSTKGSSCGSGKCSGVGWISHLSPSQKMSWASLVFNALKSRGLSLETASR